MQAPDRSLIITAWLPTFGIVVTDGVMVVLFLSALLNALLNMNGRQILLETV